MLLIPVACLGLSFVLAVVAVVSRPRRAAQPVVAPGAVTVAVPAAPDSSEELSSLYRRLGGLAARLSPGSYGGVLQRSLDRAGNPRGWRSERVHAFKGLGLTLGSALGTLIGAKHGSAAALAVATGLGVAGFFVPDLWVRNLGQRRHVEVQKALPDVIDMLTVCVEAGLGFDAALARVATLLDGPVAAECMRAVQEMQFGKSRAEALRGMSERSTVPEVRSFVSSLIQSTELGVPIGQVLRAQAGDMRVRRRQRAEEKAQKLPVRILMPLILCLLPAMFVIVLGPAIIQVSHMLSGLNF